MLRRMRGVKRRHPTSEFQRRTLDQTSIAVDSGEIPTVVKLRRAVAVGCGSDRRDHDFAMEWTPSDIGPGHGCRWPPIPSSGDQGVDGGASGREATIDVRGKL